MSNISNTDIFLITRGTNNFKVTAGDVAAFSVKSGLPSQAGNGGKFLTTDGTTLSWATVSGGGTAATLAQAATGTLNTVYSSPETAVPKDASGMAGAAILPGSNAAYSGTPSVGMIRYNSTTLPAVIEYYDNSTWVTLGGAPAASLTEAAAATITTKYLSPGTGIARDAAGTTGAALLPAGTTTQRGSITTPVTGMTRYNKTIGTLEVYTGTKWIALMTNGGSADPLGWFGHTVSPFVKL